MRNILFVSIEFKKIATKSHGNEHFNENILFKRYSPTFFKMHLLNFPKTDYIPKKEEKNIISQNTYSCRSSSRLDSTRLDFELSSLRRDDDPVAASDGKMWMEGREQREDGEEHTHARRDGCTCNSRLDLDIENSPLMTATRNAGSLVLATWPGSSPLAPRVAPLSLSLPPPLRVHLFSRLRTSPHISSTLLLIITHWIERRSLVDSLRCKK